jgi:hypothetical protein
MNRTQIDLLLKSSPSVKVLGSRSGWLAGWLLGLNSLSSPQRSSSSITITQASVGSLCVLVSVHSPLVDRGCKPRCLQRRHRSPSVSGQCQIKIHMCRPASQLGAATQKQKEVTRPRLTISPWVSAWCLCPCPYFVFYQPEYFKSYADWLNFQSS